MAHDGVATINTSLSFPTTQRQVTWRIAAQETQAAKQAAKQAVRITMPAAPDNGVGAAAVIPPGFTVPTFDELTAKRGWKRVPDDLVKGIEEW